MTNNSFCFLVKITPNNLDNRRINKYSTNHLYQFNYQQIILKRKRVEGFITRNIWLIYNLVLPTQNLSYCTIIPKPQWQSMVTICSIIKSYMDKLHDMKISTSSIIKSQLNTNSSIFLIVFVSRILIFNIGNCVRLYLSCSSMRSMNCYLVNT